MVSNPTVKRCGARTEPPFFPTDYLLGNTNQVEIVGQNKINKCPEILFSDLEKGLVRTLVENMCQVLSQTHAYKLREEKHTKAKKPQKPQKQLHSTL